MKKTFVPGLALAAALAIASPLSAAEISGKIKSLSMSGDVIALENGPTFYLTDGASLKGLKPGQTVTITYEMQADVHIAKKITAAK